MQYVYILGCSDKSHYVGCTNDLGARIERHNKGYVPATKPLLSVKLISFEKYLKSGSGRAFTIKHELSKL